MLGWVWARRAFASICLLVGLIGCSSDDSEAPAREPAQVASGGSNPLAGQAYWVDPQGPAARQAARWRAQGRRSDASAMSPIASRPTAVWLADEGVAARARAATARAAQAGKTALLVVYHVPGRDCGSYSAGGAGSPAGYSAWVRDFARGIGPRRATVILEPDAIPQAVVESCLSPQSKAQRYALLARRRADAQAALERLGLHRRGQPRLRAPGRRGWSPRCAPPASRAPTGSR